MLTAYVFITSHLTGLQAKRDERGATATEYGLLVGLIALIIVVGVGLFGNALNDFFKGLGTTVGGWGKSAPTT